MRESLTILAGVLILILSAALVVPYFVDWNAQRGLVERQLTDVLGRPVKIRGAIDLKILPTPYLRLANVEVGSEADKPDVKVDEVQLEIALPPLLRGEVDFVEAKLVRPRVALAIENGTLPLGPPIRHFTGPMRFERISVVDGALDLSDPAAGRTYALRNVFFGAEAVSLTGPFKADGRLTYAGDQSAFHLATGDTHDDRMHFKLIVDETRAHPRADLDADLIFAKVAAGLPSIEGQMTLIGHSQGEIVLPWQATGLLKAGLRQASIDTLDLRLGDDERGINLDGAAQFDLGAKPRASLTLKARDVDLDRLLTEKGAKPPLQRLVQAASELVQAKSLSGIPLSLVWSADSAILGGESLSGLSGTLAATDHATAGLRFEASGPGHSHLRLDGNLETGDAAGFKGHVEASASDAARLKQWLITNLPQTQTTLAQVELDSFDVAGEADLSAVGFVGRDLALSLDQSTLNGTLAYTLSVAGEPARLFADLSAPKLDLSTAPDISNLAGHMKTTDLSLRLDAQAVKIGNIGQGTLDTGRIHFRLEKTGALTQLDELTVTNLGGANIRAQGHWDGHSGNFTGSLDSEKLDALAALMHRLVPGATTDLLAARAGVLAPAHLTLSAQAMADTNGMVTLDHFDLSGSVAGTTVAAKINGKVGTDQKAAENLAVSARLAAPDALVLLRQLGIASLPMQGLGAGEIELAATGRPESAFATTLAATFPGAKLQFAGTVKPDPTAPFATGTLQLDSAGLTQLFEATGLAYPDPSLSLAANLKSSLDWHPGTLALNNLSGRFAGTTITGHLGYDTAKKHLTGALDADHLVLANILEVELGPLSPASGNALWSDAKLGPAMIDPPPIDLALSAKTFDLSPQLTGHDAKLDVKISGSRNDLALALQHAQMTLGPGSLAADLSFRRNGGAAASSGHLKLVGYDLNLPSLRGKLGVDLDIAGTGDSPAAIIGGLAGTGTLTLSDAILPRTDPDGMLRVFKAVESDTLSLDADEIQRAIANELEKGASHLGTLDFDAGLAAGLLRLTPKSRQGKRLDPGIIETLEGSVDLGRLSLDQRSLLTLVSLPKNWSGAPPTISLTTMGALANPERRIDSATFINALAARAIARDTARIQAQEFDLHEQAFFYNRLKSERRREDERLKQAEDERRAAALAEAAKAEAEEKAEATKTTDANQPAPAQTNSVEPDQDKAKAAQVFGPVLPAPTPMPVSRPATLDSSQNAKKPLSVVRKPVHRRPPPSPVLQSTRPADPLSVGPF